MKTLLHEALTAIAGFCEHGEIIRPIELRDKLQATIDAPEPAPIDPTRLLMRLLDQSRMSVRGTNSNQGRLSTHHPPPATELTDDEILEIGHRRVWRYAHSKDVHHSSTYTFNKTCLLTFARAVLAAQKGKV
jgi:hypothetical protein